MVGYILFIQPGQPIAYFVFYRIKLSTIQYIYISRLYQQIAFNIDSTGINKRLIFPPSTYEIIICVYNYKEYAVKTGELSEQFYFLYIMLSLLQTQNFMFLI